MPELPEVETVLRGLKPVLEGRILTGVEVRAAGLRAPFPANMAERLTGRTVLALRRRAKYILADLSGGETLVLHLGMSGRIRFFLPTEFTPQRHDHVLFFSEAATVAFNDSRRFGLMTLIETDRLADRPPLAGLGPEPLSETFTPDVLVKALAGKRTAIKAALLDQTVVAGLGNIYVCEALFRAGISPLRPAGTIEHPAVLVRAIKAVLSEAIAAGGSTLRDARFLGASGELGLFQNRLRVYDRKGEACMRRGCPGVIARVKQAGRSSFYCPVCQE
jgi:formamidopyrimidine-DNA glycosylase